MKRVRFTEEQIIEILGLHQAGAKPADLASPAWDQRGDAVQLADALWRPAGIGGQAAAVTEEENRKLKKLLAEAHPRYLGVEGYRLGKVLEACGPAAAVMTAKRCPRIEPAPGLQADRGNYVSSYRYRSRRPPTRRPFARATAHPGGCSSPVRLLPASWVAYWSGRARR